VLNSIGVALARELDDALDIVSGMAVALGALIARFSAGLVLGSKQASLSAFAIHAGLHDVALRCFWQIFEPVTKAATFCSSRTFQLMIFLDIGVIDVDRPPSWPRGVWCRPT
jgi:hypothetical protein